MSIKTNQLLRTILCLAALPMFIMAAAVRAGAQDPPNLDFRIDINGEKISRDCYRGPVTLVITLADPDSGLGLWFNDQGVWRLVTPQPAEEKGVYRLPYTQNGNYSLEFRSEDPATLAHKLQKTVFSIDSELWEVTQQLALLPTPGTSSDQELLNASQQILSARNLYNSLPDSRRALISQSQSAVLSACVSRLAALDPGRDITPPDAPATVVSGAQQEGTTYAGPVEIRLSANGGANLLMNSGSGWQQLPPDESGQYIATLTKNGVYSVRFCAEDQDGNRSQAASVDFTMDPDLPRILASHKQLFNNAQKMSLYDYAPALEDLYRDYLALSPYQQSLLPENVSKDLTRMYNQLLASIQFQNTAYDADGKYIRAVGMYRGLDLPRMYIGSRRVVLRAERSAPAGLPSGIEGTALADYRIWFEPSRIDQTDVALKPSHPLSVYIQIPDDLKGKPNIDMLYIGNDGSVVSTNAKVRSTEDNLVLRFETQSTGRFVFVSRPPAQQPQQ